ncbi:MAG: hypothetical protein NC400_14965, partial [Clostridium sp.]|nr:hypothetical protein [Clostridium sp.]
RTENPRVAGSIPALGIFYVIMEILYDMGLWDTVLGGGIAGRRASDFREQSLNVYGRLLDWLFAVINHQGWNYEG